MLKNGAYDDELTPEEEAELLKADANAPVPPAEDDDGQAPPPEEPGDKAAAPAEPAKEAEPAAQQSAAPTEDEEFQQFLAANQGKTPEELAKIAFQQQKRANKEAFQARQSSQTLENFQKRAHDALQRAQQTRQNAAEQRQQFEEKLKADPDAATKDVHEQLVARQIADADAEADQAQIDAAIGLASAAIPEFGQRWRDIHSFGGEMGYTPEELNSVRDGRDLITLYLAERFGNLVKSGICDVRGNLIGMPQGAVAQTDPRLQAPAAEAVQTLSSTPARAAGSGKTAEQQAADMLNLSDEDFDKIDPAQLENLIRQIG